MKRRAAMPTVLGVNASPFVRKVRVFLAEKNVPYDLEPVLPFNVSAEFKRISPLGKVPAFRDGKVELCDSSVICAYLERVYPKPALYPSDPYEYARALWFEEYGDSGIVNVAGPKIFLERIVAPVFFNRPTNTAVVDKAINEELPPLFDYLESQLTGADTIVGRTFSIGDIGVATHFVNLRHAGVHVDGGRWPKLKKYIDTVHARPSFRALIEEEEATFRPAA
jgi:glutathione S-transferase